MPAENIFCDEVSRMALISARELRLSIAIAISVIIGTVKTLYCGWFKTSFATGVLVSKMMYLLPSWVAGIAAPSIAEAMGYLVGCAGILCQISGIPNSVLRLGAVCYLPQLSASFRES